MVPKEKTHHKAKVENTIRISQSFNCVNLYKVVSDGEGF
jgi:hypothetical protein